MKVLKTFSFIHEIFDVTILHILVQRNCMRPHTCVTVSPIHCMYVLNVCDIENSFCIACNKPMMNRDYGPITCLNLYTIFNKNKHLTLTCLVVDECIFCLPIKGCLLLFSAFAFSLSLSFTWCSFICLISRSLSYSLIHHNVFLCINTTLCSHMFGAFRDCLTN